MQEGARVDGERVESRNRSFTGRRGAGEERAIQKKEPSLHPIANHLPSSHSPGEQEGRNELFKKEREERIKKKENLLSTRLRITSLPPSSR
jgi:hypothetical protein